MNRHQRHGFSLLELIVAIAIMSVLAGVAVPVALKSMTSAARKASRQEIEALSVGVQDYFRDTMTIPTALEDLEVAPSPAVPGWSGPYLPGAVPDRVTGLSGYQVDAWSRAYDFTIAGDVATIASRGEDGMAGTADDIAIAVNVSFIRREETLARLRIINQAVASYNANNNFAPALPNSGYSNILTTLVSGRYLPTSAGYDVDAWGDAFEPDGVLPVVKIRSTNLD